mmetsp:Transcript_66995/g.143280  ORF Transcript_66995/g.143280 Transcript_66995/m.143280 type:complete len:251 (-) Transcript_66995:1005-1757(-)
MGPKCPLLLPWRRKVRPVLSSSSLVTGRDCTGLVTGRSLVGGPSWPAAEVVRKGTLAGRCFAGQFGGCIPSCTASAGGFFMRFRSASLSHNRAKGKDTQVVLSSRGCISGGNGAAKRLGNVSTGCLLRSMPARPCGLASCEDWGPTVEPRLPAAIEAAPNVPLLASFNVVSKGAGTQEGSFSSLSISPPQAATASETPSLSVPSGQPSAHCSTCASSSSLRPQAANSSICLLKITTPFSEKPSYCSMRRS